MLAEGIISFSISDWASPVALTMESIDAIVFYEGVELQCTCVFSLALCTKEYFIVSSTDLLQILQAVGAICALITKYLQEALEALKIEKHLKR